MAWDSSDSTRGRERSRPRLTEKKKKSKKRHGLPSPTRCAVLQDQRRRLPSPLLSSPFLSAATRSLLSSGATVKGSRRRRAPAATLPCRPLTNGCGGSSLQPNACSVIPSSSSLLHLPSHFLLGFHRLLFVADPWRTSLPGYPVALLAAGATPASSHHLTAYPCNGTTFEDQH